MTTPTLTPEQSSVLDALLAYALAPSSPPFTTLGGYAGTGKTTLIKALVSRLEDEGISTCVCTPTGKAASVLRRKGVSAATIHTPVYEFVLSDNGDPVFSLLPSAPAPLVIIDEASMVNAEVFNDLMSLPRVRYIFVGDHGQLEPVGDNPNLMLDPVHRLETIHRQARDNPVIAFAHHLREGGTPTSFSTQDPRLTIARSTDDPDTYMKDLSDVYIVGTNQARVSLNRTVRDTVLSLNSPNRPIINDRIICLRNNREAGIFNGMMGEITAIRHGAFRHTISFLPDGESNPIHDLPVEPAQFHAQKTLPNSSYSINLFDYAYAITAHKSQGSEWNRVTVFDSPSRLWDSRRWRYTAVTRAAEHLTFIAP